MTAEIIADSTWDGSRITTFVVEFPRFILAELNTHRGFSRNSASSRAIPVEKLIDRVVTDPFVPSMRYNQPGMEGASELNVDDARAAREAWLDAADSATFFAERLRRRGVHKMWVNRLLEPFLTHRVIITSTPDALSNFFAQRCHTAAQPEMRQLAVEMQTAYVGSVPERRETHSPFTSDTERSVACCARVSYDNFDGTRDEAKDLELFCKLLSADPPHWSPFEHQAIAKPGRYANLDGWCSFRTMLETFSDDERDAYVSGVRRRIDALG